MHTALVCFGEKPLKVFVSAVSWRGKTVIGNVVSRVAERGFKARVEPYGVAAKLLYVIQLFDYPVEIADSVRVGVLERLGINFIEDRVVKPRGLFSRFHGQNPF